jgi:hypothetical protein
MRADAAQVRLPPDSEARRSYFTAFAGKRSGMNGSPRWSRIPTVDDLEMPEPYISLWNAFWTPRGVPKNIIGTLNAAVGQVGLAAVVRNEDGAGNSLQDARSALLAQCHVERGDLIDLIYISLIVL